MHIINFAALTHAVDSAPCPVTAEGEDIDL